MRTETRTENPTGRLPWRAVLAGIVGGGVLLAVAEAVALAFSSSSAPFVAVGGAFIDIIPPWLKDLAIGLFGTWDKPVLFASMFLVYVALTGISGWVGARSPRGATVILAGLGLIAAVVVLTRAQNGPADTIPTLAGAAVAVPTLLALLRATGPAEAHTRPPAGPHPSASSESAAGAGGDPSQRRSLLGVGIVAGLAVVVGAGARGLNASREAAQRSARQVTLPRPRTRAAEIPEGAQVTVEGMPPYVTPNDDFYRIDTALAVPRVDPASWELRIHGLVDRELTLSFDELLAEPMVEKHLTLTCVSNPVGGDLAGTATWLGVPVRTLLERAGVGDGADMVLSRSADGFTASTPLEALTDHRDSLIAVGMNGQPLPAQHGFPVRMVVPGLYGYVSATKWLTELKVTRFAEDTAYWTDRGWDERGPIKLASRVDVPRSFATLTTDSEGAVMLGGTAWAQQRGIAAVEVRLDDGDWQQAELGAEVSEDCWTQWSLRWDGADAGDHTVTVRAVDGEGEQQTEQRADPVPNGSSGWHSIRFTVE